MDRDWLVIMSISWNMPNGQVGQGGRTWLQAFDVRETEADVYQWAVEKMRQNMPGLSESTPITVLTYRAVPNIPPGHPDYKPV